MKMVGIIANPASGKDIRRLVAHAAVMGNREKANLVRRILIGLKATGVSDVRIMPDKFGIGLQAIEDLRRGSPEVVAGASILEMDFAGAGIDTIHAARMLRQAGAACIITIGGDGTARLAAKESGEVPLLPISTGTNNVLPQFIEGTVAGLAAGILAGLEQVERQALCTRSKRLEVRINDRVVDDALVDVAAVLGSFAGAKAVWEAEAIRQVAVTRASPASIGLSSLVGMIRPVPAAAAYGAIATAAPDGKGEVVSAPIGPGLIAHIPIANVERLEPDQTMQLTAERPLMLALDGERELLVKPGEEASLCLRLDGPWVVDVERVLEKAVSEGAFISG